MRHPPRGDRSLGPLRGFLYGGADYYDGANQETSLVVMIETKQGVENAKEILAVNGVDGCYIGPSDLSIAHGVRPGIGTGEQMDPVVEEAIAKVLDAARATGKVVGMHLMSAAAANRRIAPGIQMIGLGSEIRFTSAGITSALAAIKLWTGQRSGRFALLSVTETFLVNLRAAQQPLPTLSPVEALSLTLDRPTPPRGCPRPPALVPVPGAAPVRPVLSPAPGAPGRSPCSGAATRWH